MRAEFDLSDLPRGLQKQFTNQLCEISFIFNWVIILQGLAQIGIDEIATDGTVKSWTLQGF